MKNLLVSYEMYVNEPNTQGRHINREKQTRLADIPLAEQRRLHLFLLLWNQGYHLTKRLWNQTQI